MRYHPLIPALVFAAALAWGFLWVSGLPAALGFLLVGLFGGFALRSWRALPILVLGLLLGQIASIIGNSRWLLTDLRFDTPTILLLGKGAFGLLLSYVPLTLFLALLVAIGKWLGTPRPPRTLANWHK